MGVRHVAAVLGVLAAIAYSTPASAQYFGRNKVRYDQAPFHTLHTEHFDVYFRADGIEAARLAARVAEGWYTRLSQVFAHELSTRQPLILYTSHAAFEQTNVISGFLGESIGGVTESQQRRIILPFDAGLAETDHVIGHELVHAFQYDISSTRKSSLAGLPLWFVEGMAEFLSAPSSLGHSSLLVRDAAVHGTLPAIRDLGRSAISPYRAGHALFAWLASEYGDAVIPKIFSIRSRNAVRRIELATGADAQTLTSRWHEFIKAGVSSTRQAPAGVPVVNGRNGGRINVAPALSPDGTRLVFLSERDGLSIDVFLAETATGHIRRKLLTTIEDPHIESLGFLRSTASWSPDGRQIVLGLVKYGRPLFAFYDAARGALVREVGLAGVDQVFQASWAPDGRRIAFAGLSGGVSDLFTFDVKTAAVDRLTDDAFSDLQPVWSPDGRRLAFTTNRGTADLAGLHFGQYQLATFDLASAAITLLPDVEGGAVDPQWTADGVGLIFRGDLRSAPDVFHLRLEENAIERLTTLETGVMGLTPYSPAISVARDTGAIAFTTLDNGVYVIRLLDAAQQAPQPAAADAKPELRLASRLPRMFVPRSSALASAEGEPPKPYISKMALAAIGRPSFSMGAGGGGGFVRGGTSFLFSDVLGDRRFGIAAQAGKRVEDLAIHGLYLDRTTRWTWGAGLDLFPYVDASRDRATDGAAATRLVEHIERQRQMHSVAYGLLAYPFNRTLRVETRAGYHMAHYHRATRQRTFSLADGSLLNEAIDHDAPSPPALSLVEVSAALVRDTAVFGPVSPLVGSRMRVEFTTTGGDLAYRQWLSDIRKYWRWPRVPLVAAVRMLHAGRYGEGADDPRLVPFSLRRSALVRGVEGAYLSAGDSLVGSRVLAVQVEARVPLASLMRRRWQSGLPVEVFAFADGGSAWNRQERPAWFGGSRASARSAGAGARVGLGGFALEVAAAHRFGREAPGWKFAFNLRPPF